MKQGIILISILMFIGCFYNYHYPYVNIEETSKLKLGMSKKEAYNLLGKPLYIKSGKKSDNTKKIEWAYQVRAEEFEQLVPIFSKPNLKKKGKINSDSPPINQLILVFNNGVLQEWYSASGDLANSKPSYIRNTLTIGLGLAAISTFGISIILSIVSGS